MWDSIPPPVSKPRLKQSKPLSPLFETENVILDLRKINAILKLEDSSITVFRVYMDVEMIHLNLKYHDELREAWKKFNGVVYPEEKSFSITLNSKPLVTEDKEWKYEDVVNHLPNKFNTAVYSVLYIYPREVDKRDGTLYPGGPAVALVSGMIFEAYVTGNA